jgi:hypothetical protein
VSDTRWADELMPDAPMWIRDLVDEALAGREQRIAALEVEVKRLTEGWRPIITAPTDETVVLLLTRSGIVSGWRAPGVWSHGIDGSEYDGPVWSCLDDAVTFEIEEGSQGDGSDHHGSVTHWMPLPPLPEGHDNVWARAALPGEEGTT